MNLDAVYARLARSDGDDWRAQAACLGHAPELFHPETSDVSIGRMAQRICKRCPVAARCLDEEMRVEPPTRRFGVVGGLTPNQRRVLWRSGWRPGDPHPDMESQVA